MGFSQSGIRVWAILASCLMALSLPLDAGSEQVAVAVRLTSEAYRDALARGLVPSDPSADYGAWAWLELSPAELAHLRQAGVPHLLVTDPFRLTLGELRFDPARDRVRLPAGWEASGEAPGLQLVQLDGPIRDDWLLGLHAAGLELVQYIHPFTYVVWASAAELESVAQAEGVRWVGAFAPAFKVLPQWRALPEQAVAVDVMLYRGAGEAETLQALRQLGVGPVEYALLDHRFGVASLALPGDAFRDAAHIPGVYSLQPQPLSGGLRGEVNNQVNAGNVDGEGQALFGYGDWLAQVGVDGSGVIMAHVDAGIEETHPDLAARMLSCSGVTCGQDATSTHGTHTAGIVAADGSSGALAQGFLRGQGVAPGANLVEQMYWPWYRRPNGLLLLMSESEANGALISSNSWGPADTPRGYDVDTLQVDMGVRDADPSTPGNQPLIYVLSVMNGGGGYQSQGTPDEAKNILTVGSTQMQRSSGAQNLDIDNLSVNTAHGPCLDGRYTPQLVAPGCFVDSTIVSGHDLMCGTSMASPNVSGAVALFAQYYHGLTGRDPSPALVKAAFFPVAHDLAGHRDADGNFLGHPVDSKQGWGRLCVEAVVDPTESVLYYDRPHLLDHTGEVWSVEVVPADPARAMRLMLVWTDAPGHGLGGSTPAWNNDLDLVVDTGSDLYVGNAFGADGWSQPAGAADPRNNAEGVFLAPGATGSAQVSVVAANLTSDGVPGLGDSIDQDFALVCYNCRRQGDFSLSVSPPALDGCQHSTVTGTIVIDEIGHYQEWVRLQVGALPAEVTAVCAPGWVMPPSESSLRLIVAGAATGRHTLTVSGTGAWKHTQSVAVDLWLHDRRPLTVAPTTPANGVTGVAPASVVLAWLPAGEARDYRLQVSEDPAFRALQVNVDGLPATFHRLTVPLHPLTCYYWRVRGENACGAGAWSLPWRFCTGPQHIYLPLMVH